MFKIAIFSICCSLLFTGGVCHDLEHIIRYSTRQHFKDLLSANISPKCKRDMLEYSKGIQNLKSWALKMADSMEKFPSGLLWGRKTAFGQLDECLEVVHPNFTGQYCVMEMALRKFTQNATLQIVPTILHRSLGQFSYGICVPSTCTVTDLNNAVSYLGMNKFLTSKIFNDGCSKKGEVNFRTKDYMFMALFLVLILFVVASTAYDVNFTFVKKKAEIKRKVLTSFSLYSNAKHIFEITENSQGLELLHGLRFFSYTWVVLGHLYHNAGTLENELHVTKALKERSKTDIIPVTNAYLSVDSFFFIAGFLICSTFFRDISVKKSYDAPVALIRRYFRLMPSLGAVILFNSTIFSRTIVSPYTKILFGNMETACRNYWWTFVLNVENFYFDETRKCFSPAWYLAADMQMFLISPLILYVLLLKPKFAPKYLGLLILGTAFASFFVSYRQNLPPNRSLQYFQQGSKVKIDTEYFLFLTRMTPWLIGIATAYFTIGIKAKKITFRPKLVWVVVGWLLCAFLCLISLYGIAFFYPYEKSLDYPAISRSLYRSLHRVGWALGLSWIVITSSSGYGGPINWFLSFNVYQPLAKLSYCAFLIHYNLQKFRCFNAYRTVKNFNLFDLIYMYIGDVAISTTLAIPMSLLIELPFFNLARNILDNIRIYPYPKITKNKC